MLGPAPRSQVQLGNTTVTYLPDGAVHVEPTLVFPASAPDGWAAYAQYLDQDGRLTASVGSFLVRTESHSVLVDLGLGQVDFEIPGLASYSGGRLLENLRGEGLTPEDIDMVVFTHLHRDHVGWTSNVAPSPNTTDYRPVTGLTFARARHLVDRAEWDHWSATRRAPAQIPTPC